MRTRIWACTAGAMILASSLMAQQKRISKKEREAFMAIQQATTPDARIAAADKFVTSFADSDLRSTALNIAAEAAERKNDMPQAVSLAQSALDIDAKDYDAMLLISGELARSTHENDLDKDDKLAKADKLAHDAIAGIPSSEKPFWTGATAEQWESHKKDMISEGHEDLGLVAMDRKKYEVAVAEFKQAVDGAGTPDPATSVRLAGAYDAAGKPDDAIAVLDKLLADPNLNPVIKQFASGERARALTLKNKK